MSTRSAKASEPSQVEFKPHFVVRSIESERVPRPSTGNPEKDREFSDTFVKKIIAILDASEPLDDSSS